MEKKFIRKIAGIMVASVLTINLTACGNYEKNDNISEPETTYGTTTTEELELGRKAMIDAYIKILEGIYINQKLPDGTDLDFFDGDDISENKFAIYDIDKDGKEEMIIEYTTSSMAGMLELIYDFDTSNNTVTEEFIEFPNLTFYNNGIIKAGLSHNQGYGGDFWPYTLYQYNEEMDKYDNAGMVDAWDKSISETDYDGNHFPENVDVDKDGMVYYIMPDGSDGLDEPVDLEEYNQWYHSYVGDAKEVKIPFTNLTEENIQNIK